MILINVKNSFFKNEIKFDLSIDRNVRAEYPLSFNVTNNNENFMNASTLILAANETGLNSFNDEIIGDEKETEGEGIDEDDDLESDEDVDDEDLEEDIDDDIEDAENPPDEIENEEIIDDDAIDRDDDLVDEDLDDDEDEDEDEIEEAKT